MPIAPEIRIVEEQPASCLPIAQAFMRTLLHRNVNKRLFTETLQRVLDACADAGLTERARCEFKYEPRHDAVCTIKCMLQLGEDGARTIELTFGASSAAEESV